MSSAHRDAIKDVRPIIDCVILMARKIDLEVDDEDVPGSHIASIDDDLDLIYPEPDAKSICVNSAHRKAVLLLMRHPTMYDGDAEFTFELYLWPAIKLLFSGLNISAKT